MFADIREHPGYRLIVDLRDNGGGDSEPFRALIDGIRADPGLNRRGLVFGLVNGLTDSSATLDAGYLQHETRAALIGTAVMDPIDEYGNGWPRRSGTAAAKGWATAPAG